jgi:rod shape-determining protein MreD
MALLAASRRETEASVLPIAVVLLAPVLALGLESFVPVHFPPFAILDLPLLLVIYFAIARRSTVTGVFAGATIGLLQDAMTRQPLGVFGISNTIIGYLSGLVGNRIDTDNYTARLLFIFVFTLLHSFLYWLLVHRFLAEPASWSWIHEPLRAAVNAVVGVLLFALLDMTRRGDE